MGCRRRCDKNGADAMQGVVAPNKGGGGGWDWDWKKYLTLVMVLYGSNRADRLLSSLSLSNLLLRSTP